MTVRNNDLRIQSHRYPSVVRHAGAIFPVAYKTPQHPAVIVSAYLQKKHRLPPEEKRAVSAHVFHALRLFPLAGYAAVKACRKAGWDVGLALRDKRYWFSLKFLPEQAGYSIVAAASLLGFHAYTQALAPDDQPEDGPAGVASFLETHTTCPAVDTWVQAVLEYYDELRTATDELLRQSTITDDELSLLSIRACVSPWILQSWASSHPDGWSYALALAESLCMPSPVGLRVHGGAHEREQLLLALEKMNIPARFGNLSPAGLILEERARVTDLDVHREGLFEIQDEGSQIIGFAVHPVPGGRVLDACAGAGGKTLHLASLMNNSGSIIASDIEIKRLKQVLPRAARAGIDCIKTVSSRVLERSLDDYCCSFSAVLVDAPCTSLGTARRYPIPKWRLEEKSLRKINESQRTLLARYAETVRPGGIIVYATCSLLPQENTEIVEEFLHMHPDFASDPLGDVFRAAGVHIEGLKADTYTCALTPLEHGTDGFFMARMKRL